MAYTARLLITRALYLSNVVARDFETSSGDEITDGLFLLNALLGYKGTDTSLIPYYRREIFSLIVGVEEYFRTNLLQVETLTFNIGPVRYPMTSLSRSQYFGSGRVDNIEAIPLQWHAEREEDGTRIFIYYKPEQAYVATLWGKFGLANVTLDTDLQLTYDNFYIEFLRYSLAEYICQYYDVEFTADKKEMLSTMEKKLAWVSPPDLTMQKMNLLASRTTLNWAQINIGQGWQPG